MPLLSLGLTQPAHGDPGTSPEGHLKVLTSRTCTGPSGDQYKKLLEAIIKKLLEAIVLLLYIYFCFLQEEQLFKSSERGRPRDWDPVMGRHEEQMMGCSRDVRGT